MPDQIPLKSSNRKAIWFLVVFDILLLSLCLKGDSLSWELASLFQKSTIAVVLTTTAGSLIAGFLNEFFSPHLKAVLVFWRTKYPLLGHRAFSEVVHQDPRIDLENLRKSVGQFPESPVEQNQLWYRLYRKHMQDTAVISAHQNFLLYRDCASLTCLMMVFLLVASLILNVAAIKLLIAFTALVLQYGLCVIAAQNTGKRLIQNVLALESVNK